MNQRTTLLLVIGSMIALTAFTFYPEKSGAILTAEGKVEQFLSVEDGKFILIDRIALYTNEANVIGYYGTAAQGEESFYLIGKRVGNDITGKMTSLYDKKSTAFKLKITASSAIGLSQLKKPTPRMKEDLFRDDATGYSYFGSREFTIFEHPNNQSRILHDKLQINNKGFKLVEIGKMQPNWNEDNSDRYNIWYRIKNNEIDGWVFGLLTAV